MKPVETDESCISLYVNKMFIYFYLDVNATDKH